MNRFEKFMAKPKIVKLEGLEFKVYPLNCVEYAELLSLKKEERLIRILKKILKDSFSDLTKEEEETFLKAEVTRLEPLFEAFAEVNGFDEQLRKLEFLEKIKKAQHDSITKGN